MVVAIVLAAGKGTRMRSALPKVAHKLAGLAMIEHIHRMVESVPGAEPLYVLGHGSDVIRELLPADARIVMQAAQLGTAHAVSIALEALPQECEQVFVLYGDMPLLNAATLERMRADHNAHSSKLTLLTTTQIDPHGYGRIVRNAEGNAEAIVEEKWLDETQRSIREVNTGVYVIETEWLRSALPSLTQHADGELYLTDLAAAAAGQGGLHVIADADPDEVIGINDRVGLAHAEGIMRLRVNQSFMRAGVTLLDPGATYIAADAAIGADSVIEPTVVIDTGVTIGERCHIGSGTRLVASSLGNDCIVHASHIEFSEIADHVRIGPFSHLRAGSVVGCGSHIGNFAEIKNSTVGDRTRMGHFSYVGDAQVGVDVNIGAGSVTVNYDGDNKHVTVIGDNAFIGSGTMLRAPIAIGASATTGAGSVVLHDVAEGTTVAGVPAKVLKTRQ